MNDANHVRYLRWLLGLVTGLMILGYIVFGFFLGMLFFVWKFGVLR